MARPALVNVNHGQQSWDADLQTNINITRDQSIPVPQYANEAALPAASANDRCLAVTIDENRLWQSNGTVWHPQDGVLNQSIADNSQSLVSGAQVDLDSYTVAANVNDKNENRLEVEAHISDNLATDAVNYRLFVDGVVIGQINSTASNGTILIEAVLIRRAGTGAGTRYRINMHEFSSTGAQILHFLATGLATVDWTTATIIKITAQDIALNPQNAVQHEFHVRLIR